MNVSSDLQSLLLELKIELPEASLEALSNDDLEAFQTTLQGLLQGDDQPPDGFGSEAFMGFQDIDKSKLFEFEDLPPKAFLQDIRKLSIRTQEPPVDSLADPEMAAPSDADWLFDKAEIKRENESQDLVIPGIGLPQAGQILPLAGAVSLELQTTPTRSKAAAVSGVESLIAASAEAASEELPVVAPGKSEIETFTLPQHHSAVLDKQKLSADLAEQNSEPQLSEQDPGVSAEMQETAPAKRGAQLRESLVSLNLTPGDSGQTLPQSRVDQAGFAPNALLQNAPLNQPAQALNLAPLTTHDLPQMAQQLGDRVMVMVNAQLNQAELRLDPPHLGELDIQLKLDDDRAIVQIQAANPHARELLDNAAQRLREVLQQAGYAEVNVDVSGRERQQSHEQGFARSEAEAINGVQDRPGNDAAAWQHRPIEHASGLDVFA